jgi:RNA polymerase sigma factor (sigma-70 family)
VGDRGFEDFYREFLPTLVGFLIWQGAGRAHAEDLAAETMLRAFHSWDRVLHPQAWCRTVGYRLLMKDVVGHPEEPVPRPPERPGDGLIDQEVWAQQDPVLRLLSRLPMRQRQVLAWSVDGYSPAEIAVELRLAPDNVRQNLKKAREQMLRLLHADKEDRG